MNPEDHAVIDAAVKAKRAQQQRAATKPAPQSSTVSKAVSAGIWAAAAGSLVAVFLSN